MDKKYKLKFQPKINITLIAVIAICICGIICDSIFLGLAIKNQSPCTAYIVSLALLCVLLVLISIFAFGSYYKFSKEKFIISIFFLKTKIDYSDILNIRHDKSSKQTIVYYHTYSKTGEPMVSMFYLNIHPSQIDSIVSDFKDKNNMIIYDLFNEEDTNEQN